MTQEYENHQIIRIDGKNKFVEILNRNFDIGKVTMTFVEYDEKQSAGNRIVAQIPIFWNFPEFRRFAQDVLSGRYAAMAKEAKGPLESLLKGTSVERLQKQGRPRPDGKAESRKFSLSPSTKGFFFTAELGPGVATETGLIKPDGKAEKKVSIPITPEHAKELVLATLAAMNAYESAKETTKQLEALFKSQGILK